MMKTHPLENLIEHYLQEKDISQGTFAVYEIILKQYLNYLITNNITYAEKRDVVNYIAGKESQGYSTHWLWQQLTVVKGLYKYLSKHQKWLKIPEVYADDITASIKNIPREKTTAKPILTIAQAKHLILYLQNNRKWIWNYRDYAMIYLMITTGLRSIEIRRARIKDLKMINGEQILYVQGKGRSSADAFVKITDGLNEAISDYLQKRQDKNPYLFVSRSHRSTNILHRTAFLKIFRRILKDAGLEDANITPHCLRHTAATMNLLRGGTLKSTKQLMRHEKLATTMIYAHHLDLIHDDSENKIEQYILGKDQK